MYIGSKARVKSRIVFLVLCTVVIFTGCVACSPQTRSPQSEADAGSSSGGMPVSFSMDSDCGLCHEAPMRSEGGPGSLVNSHTKKNGLACISCHSESSGLVSAHDGITSESSEPKKLKKAKISESTCLSCHGSYEELSQKTTDSSVLIDVDGLRVNPHEASQLNEAHAEEITCLKCHGEHKEKTEADMQAYCFNCHHAKVYECNTCHEYHA